MVELIEAEDLDDAVAVAGPVVILAWAPACGACYQISRQVDLAAEEFRGVDFYRLDVRDVASADAVRRLRIGVAPTVLLFRGGAEAARFEDPPDASGLFELLAAGERKDRQP